MQRKIEELLDLKKYTELENLLKKQDILSVTKILEQLCDKNLKTAFGLLPKETAAETLMHLNYKTRLKLVSMVCFGENNREQKPYFKTGVIETFLKRIPWLLILMISATFTGGIIRIYEQNLISGYVVLTAFIPMLMGTGGNSGSQAAVSVIRGISLGEIKASHIFLVIWKEIRVAVLCGITLSAATFLKLFFIDQVSASICTVVCLTLVVTVFIAKLIGCCLPVAAKALGIDPAVMASPFIATIVDAISLIIYFLVASFILGF